MIVRDLPASNSGKTESATWITVAQTARALDVSERWVRYVCQNPVPGSLYAIKRGKKAPWEIHLESLPQSAQDRHHRLQDMNAMIDKARPEPRSLRGGADDAFLYMPEWQRQRALYRKAVLNACQGMRRKSEIKAAIKEFLIRDPGKVSYASLMRWRLSWDAQGWQGLADDYGQQKKSVTKEQLDVFASLYLKEGEPAARKCWLATIGILTEQKKLAKSSDMPSVGAFLRALRAAYPADSIALKRLGQHRFKQSKYSVRVQRDYDNLDAGFCWVGDHHQFDVMVEMPNGKVVRPWLSLWVDFKTNKWIGWNIHADSPNSLYVLQALSHGLASHPMPGCIYIDNGKDYQSISVSNEARHKRTNANPNAIRSAVELLSIRVVFAIPYQAQAKIIERQFKDLESMLRPLHSYVGQDTNHKPEELRRVLKKGGLMSIGDFTEQMDHFIQTVVNLKPSETLDGMSPQEAWEKGWQGRQGEMVSEQSRILLAMPASTDRPVTRDGVRDMDYGVFWRADWMPARIGTKVYLRRDPRDLSVAFAFDAENGNFIGECEQVRYAPALAQTDEESKIVKEEIERQRRILRRQKDDGKTAHEFTDAEILRAFSVGVSALNKDRGYEPSTEPVKTTLRKTALDGVADVLSAQENVPLQWRTRAQEQHEKLYLSPAEKRIAEMLKNREARKVANTRTVKEGFPVTE